MSGPIANARRALVLGGGVAGITAAFLLRDRGFAVELHEAHRGLGGRAFTLPARPGEPPIDNGPHVILGCYDAFSRLLNRLGTARHFAPASRLSLAYRERDGRASSLRLLPGPVPLTFPLALLCTRALSMRDRLRAARGLIAATRVPVDGASLAQWLARHGQDGGPRRVLWDPLCRAIANAEAEEIDAALMLATLKRAFGGSGRRAAILIPDAPWSAILGEPALASLRANGVGVEFASRIDAIEVDGGAVVALRVANGVRRAIARDDLVVSALPWHALARALPGVTAAAKLDGKPMLSVAFWCDHDPGLPADLLIALVDGEPFHFFCRRAGDPPDRFALISGGARGLDGIPTEAIVERALAQLVRAFPGARLASGVHARVSMESRATLWPRPGESALRPRPGPVDGIGNFVLAGDWTATGLPSTLEGAALSAESAIDRALAQSPGSAPATRSCPSPNGR